MHQQPAPCTQLRIIINHSSCWFIVPRAMFRIFVFTRFIAHNSVSPQSVHFERIGWSRWNNEGCSRGELNSILLNHRFSLNDSHGSDLNKKIPVNVGDETFQVVPIVSTSMESPQHSRQKTLLQDRSGRQ